MSNYGARHRYATSICTSTAKRNFMSLSRLVRAKGDMGTKSGVVTGGVKGKLTLFVINDGPLRGNVGVLKTRVSSPEVSLGRIPLCRSASVTLLSARCCNNVGGCR